LTKYGNLLEKGLSTVSLAWTGSGFACLDAVPDPTHWFLSNNILSRDEIAAEERNEVEEEEEVVQEEEEEEVVQQEEEEEVVQEPRRRRRRSPTRGPVRRRTAGNYFTGDADPQPLRWRR
jgi:hypothetical protein